MAVQAVRCINLGYVGNETGSYERVGTERCQPGYVMYIPSDDISYGEIGRAHV